MSFLTASAFLKALGWALLNSLWQFAACWLFYYILTSGIKNLTAAARHTIALSLLFLGTTFFISGLYWKYNAAPAETGTPLSRLIIENTSYYNSWHAADTFMDALMPYWSLLYLVCIVLLFFKLCFFVRRAGNLQHTGITKMSAAWRTYIKTISAQLGIQKEVKAFLSVHIDTPQVIGFLKPVILVPAACLANLSTEQLEAVLLHELLHIKRNDYLVNLFVASVEILFFFNPFVKQITGNIRKEREYTCDDMVMQFQYHPRNYASALLTLEKNRLIPVTYGIAASGKNQKQLLARIERIIGIKNKEAGFYRAGAFLATFLLLGFIATINPAKRAIEKLDEGYPGMAKNSILGLEYNVEANTSFTPPNKPAGNTTIKEENQSKKTSIPATPHKNNNEDAINEDGLTILSAANDADEAHVLVAAGKEQRDFSLQQKEAVATPYAAAPAATTEEPYVPSGSFSYQFTQDTSMPKIKGETYNERRAKEALVKAQKAMEQINWQKIEKQLKYKKQDIAKLKKEIIIQLQNLNWQNINSEVQNQLSQEQLEKLLEAFKQEQSIKEYRQNEANYEALQRQLLEQEQVIKESELRMRENQKAAEQQQKKLQAEMKKRRIIYI